MHLSTPTRTLTLALTTCTLLSLLPASLSAPNPHPLPQSHGSPSTPSPETQPFTFTISALWAYIPSPSSTPPAPPAPATSPSNASAPQQQSWIAFQIHEDGGGTALCSVFTEGALSRGYVFWGCEMLGEEEEEVEGRHGDGKVRYSFAVGEGFGALSVKKGWWVGGTYTIGYATQATNWVEGGQGEGRNVTVDEHGKLYSRWEAWEFEITRLVA